MGGGTRGETGEGRRGGRGGGGGRQGDGSGKGVSPLTGNVALPSGLLGLHCQREICTAVEAMDRNES